MNKLKLFDLILYGCQTILNYFLMLVAMSYSAWLLLAVVFGMTIGNGIFLKQQLPDIQIIPAMNSKNIIESCHYGTISESITNSDHSEMNHNETEDEISFDTSDTSSQQKVITVEVHC